MSGPVHISDALVGLAAAVSDVESICALRIEGWVVEVVEDFEVVEFNDRALYILWRAARLMISKLVSDKKLLRKFDIRSKDGTHSDRAFHCKTPT